MENNLDVSLVTWTYFECISAFSSFGQVTFPWKKNCSCRFYVMGFWFLFNLVKAYAQLEFLI